MRAQEREARVRGGLAGEHLEEVPLRQEHQVGVGDLQAREVGRRIGAVGERDLEIGDLAVGERMDPASKVELVHQVESRGVNGVASEVAQEVLVLLEHDDLDALTSEQEGEHEARGAPADDANAGLDRRPRRCHASES
jgi:hypothetical protein